MSEINTNNRLEIIRYTPEYKNIWDEFCRNAKNPLFMFQRGFMEYHGDRFEDHSLIFLYKNKVIALLPANQKGDELQSHGGLTYGGFIVDNNMKQHIMNECVASLIAYCNNNSISRVLYKTIPHIYHKQPCEEEIYSLYFHGAKQKKIEAATVVDLSNPLKYARDRRGHISRAKREGIEVRELTEKKEYSKFISIENEVLQGRHGVNAVHTGDELKMLRDRFPDNIRLIGGYSKETMISGAVLFEYENIVHTQYLAATDAARAMGGLDIVVDYIINKYTGKKKWLDFGISTEDNGKFLNEGLISQKEGFGGRTIIYSTWEIICC